MSDKTIHLIKIDTIEELNKIDELVYFGFSNTMRAFTKIQNILYERLQKDPDNTDIEDQYDYISDLRQKADVVFANLKYGPICHIFTDLELENADANAKTLVEMREELKQLKGKVVRPVHRNKDTESLCGTLTGIGVDSNDYFYVIDCNGREIFINCLEGIEEVK